MYKVTALSISGKHGKTHYQGSVIPADQLYSEHIQSMLADGSITNTTEDAVQTAPVIPEPEELDEE